MSTKLLVRDMPKHGQDDPIDELNDTLLVSASRVLGYQAPEDTADAKWIAENEALLAKALKKLDIRPFTQASVDAYKASAAEAERGKFKTRKVELYEIANKAFDYLWPATILTLAASGLAALCGVNVWVMAAGFVPLALFIVSVATLCTYVDDFSRWSRREFTWYSSKIGDLRGLRIPEFALQTAIDLKEACPEATIYVEQLQEYSRPTPDPFLYAVIERPKETRQVMVRSPWSNESTRIQQTVSPGIATRRYYLEVWNEPKYKQEREV